MFLWCIWGEGLINFSIISSCSATSYRLCQYHKGKNKQRPVTNVAMKACLLVPSEGMICRWELQYVYLLLGLFLKKKKDEVCYRRLLSCAFSLWFWREGDILRTCQPFWSGARNQGKSNKTKYTTLKQRTNQFIHKFSNCIVHIYSSNLGNNFGTV